MATTKSLSEQLSKLQTRINQLVDEIHTVKKDLQRFKGDVAKDVTYLTERVEDR